MKISEINEQIKDAVELINDTLLRDVVFSTLDSFSVTPEGLTIGEEINNLRLGKNTNSSMNSGKMVFKIVFGEPEDEEDDYIENPEYEVEIVVQLRADVTVGQLKKL